MEKESSSNYPLKDSCAPNIVLQWFYKIFHLVPPVVAPSSCVSHLAAPWNGLNAYLYSLFRAELFALWTDRSAPWSVRDS